MRIRAETSISERQLIVALAKSGRETSLAELALWRKNGLLPPLVGHGMRTAGRGYFWNEPDILPRAELIYDALRKYGRNETATISLWLYGFDVPPSRVRRAWLHRAKLASPVRIRSPNDLGCWAGAPVRTLPELLLAATHYTAISVEPIPDLPMPILKRAVAALGIAPGAPDTPVQLYWQTAMVMSQALSSSDVIPGASDNQMLQAQHRLQVILKFLTGFCRDESPSSLVDALGPVLFPLILALLRSGQHSVIQAVIDRIDTDRGKLANPRPREISDRAPRVRPIAAFP